MATRLKIPAGHIRFTNLLRAFLGADPCVTVGYNEVTEDIEVTVTGCSYKAECLDRILAPALTPASGFCNKDHNILVNGKRDHDTDKIKFEHITAALSGNPFFIGIEEHSMPMKWGGLKRWFGMLAPGVIQASNDNFGNPYGIESFLAEDFVPMCFRDAVLDKVAWTTDRK